MVCTGLSRCSHPFAVKAGCSGLDQVARMVKQAGIRGDVRGWCVKTTL